MNIEQAIEKMGQDIVDELHSQNCIETNRVIDDFIEFQSTVCKNDTQYTMYYYITKDEFESCESLDQIDWWSCCTEYSIENGCL